jgi:pentatricopeptide repeat protein
MMAAREALRLSPNLGEAHAALGKLYTVRGRWAEAETSLRRGVELSPQYSTARQWLGTLYMRLRRCDEARTQVEIGARLDPLTQLVNQAVGGVYANCGAPELAVPVLESVLKMHPDSNSTHYVLGRVLVRLGRVDEAIRHIEIAHRPGDETFATCALMHAYVKAGRLDDARRILAGIQRNYYVRAAGAASLGDTALMFEQLEQAIAHNSTAFPNLLIEPAFEPYFDDARFVDIARRVGFPVPIPSGRFTDHRATTQPSQ